ncbi:MAG: patatin-like phospholipase family protein [Pseudomonadota bacterium]
MVTDTKLGLALGGGGARGLAHIVVMEVLDELGLKVDAISGSSIGALLGMGYASGMSGRDLRAYALETFADRAAVAGKLWSLRPSSFQDWFNPRSYSVGQINPQKILQLFTPIETLPENLQDLRIPMSVVTTDYYGWHEVVHTEGTLSEVVGASIAIPMVFKPVRVAGRVMIDGNITNPLPFEHLTTDMDQVIAVDVVGGPNAGGPHAAGDDIPSGFESMLGANQIMMQAITREKLAQHKPPDVLLRPPINEFGVLDFLKASTILRVTEVEKDAMKRAIEERLGGR